MVTQDIYIIGAGTYGEVLFELAEILGYTVKGFYDDAPEKQKTMVMGKEVLGKFSDLKSSNIKGVNFVIAIGNNDLRLSLIRKILRFDGCLPSLVHPLANVSPSAQIGRGVYVHAYANIWTKVSIGDGTFISPNVVIAHHTKIGECCLISTLSGIGANIIIGDKVYFGMGSTIMTGVKRVVNNTVIGAGTVVIKSIDTAATYAGVPAKLLVGGLDKV